MKRIEYSKDKNELLKQKRGISFEDVVTAIENNNVIATAPHPNAKRYPKQYIFFILIEEYIYAIPYIESEDKIFLKTIYPSRKFTKKYLKGVKHEKAKI